jgi:hypothetical protein
MTQEWSLDGRGDWRSAGDIRVLPEAMQQVGKIALMTPGLYRLRRMSPLEVGSSIRTTSFGCRIGPSATSSGMTVTARCVSATTG